MTEKVDLNEVVEYQSYHLNTLTPEHSNTLTLFPLLRAMIRYLWPAFAWAIITLVLTLMPGKDLPDVHFFQVDKVAHFFIFGVLMILTSWGLKKTTGMHGAPVHPLLTAALLSIGFGILIEFLQRFVPGRSFSIADMLANSIGVGLGYLIFRLLKKRKLE